MLAKSCQFEPPIVQAPFFIKTCLLRCHSTIHPCTVTRDQRAIEVRLNIDSLPSQGEAAKSAIKSSLLLLNVARHLIRAARILSSTLLDGRSCNLTGNLVDICILGSTGESENYGETIRSNYHRR